MRVLNFPEIKVDHEILFLTIKEASDWASEYLNKNVTTSNISYLINYGKIEKINKNGLTFISKTELKEYYDKINSKKNKWKEILGEDLNWTLSFENLKESETTKHVHRLHPYKGKYIPQLVEYFIDKKTDNFKKETYFKENDIILDPFNGSGTTMIVSNELNIHAIGIDISEFNTLMANVKIAGYNISELKKTATYLINKLREYLKNSSFIILDNLLQDELSKFNNEYFSVPEYKIKVKNKEIDEKDYSKEKENEFNIIFSEITQKLNIDLVQKSNETFLGKWYLKNIREEINYIYNEIEKIQEKGIKYLFYVILSRTIRSCRATTHSDLATLKEPITKPYYCTKHYKICKPLLSIQGWFEDYCKDTIQRIEEFGKIKTNTFQICLNGDSRSINIFEKIKESNNDFYKLLEIRKIDGIFSSPPYVGIIDYHEQHAYAYELFNFKRNDESEIGPLFKGQGKEAKESYVKGISDVLNNCKKYLKKDYNIFLVSNDKYNLYPTIAENAGMKIVNHYKRPVLNRTEKDKNAYAEIIFHLKEK